MKPFTIFLPALLLAIPLQGAEHRQESHGTGTAFRPAVVDRAAHGSIRHEESFRHPVEIHPQIEHRTEVRTRIERRPEVRHDVFVHHDVDVDFHRRHFWNDFAFGRHITVLPSGFLNLQIGGVPYYYYDGTYFQPAPDGYQEVYPPIGAAIPQPPDGAIEVSAGNQIYYYAGGAFYVQQPDGSFAIAPAPIGVIVPELPPGAVQVSVRGALAYQFNGIYYQPVFVNGVTEYQTFLP
jgi:hypothetical protein